MALLAACRWGLLPLLALAARPPGEGLGEFIVRSMVAKQTSDIIKIPCLKNPPDDVAWRYAPPVSINFAHIDGVILKYHCPGLDTILWDKVAQRAYWVSPVQFLSGLFEDLLTMKTHPPDEFGALARDALYKGLHQAFEKRSRAFPVGPVSPGCVEQDYSRSRQCFGRAGRPSPVPPRATSSPTPDDEESSEFESPASDPTTPDIPTPAPPDSVSEVSLTEPQPPSASSHPPSRASPTPPIPTTINSMQA
ncbi:envelope glycoprotein L [Pteropodid alphaherpesvirus 1]|uniref:Envelope glycoprotein L n=1 Tax=Pteropodid alphaherpesvirus 1 TaxID=1343901 RepID=A0A060Q4Y2_9ALPH|nr:envelope glycoprotein L [Pteropodid alphaherpesvirus 1]BAP00680.1 envelope glycoprotein L [Pteropodid alphaherpesvirus 1]